MSPEPSSSSIIHAGDVEGRTTVYGPDGELKIHPGESVLAVASGWDLTAQTPWRWLLPQVMFLGKGRPVSSQLYVTTARIVLIRDIDPLREVRGELTPLGMPNAVSTGIALRNLRTAGVRQFCEIQCGSLRLMRIRRSRKLGASVELRLIGSDGKRYSISFWKTVGEDPRTAALIESRFRT